MQKTTWLLPAALLLAGSLGAAAQTAQKPTVTSYDFGDRCFISTISANGKWALTGATADSEAPARLIDLTTGKSSTFPAGSEINDVTDNGKLVGGSTGGKAAVYDVDKGTWQTLPVPSEMTLSAVHRITPDGRYAVGMGWVTSVAIDGAKGLMWDLQTKKLMDLPNLPQRSGLNSEILGYKFTDISDDGRYVVGMVDWNQLLDAGSGLFEAYVYVYDRENSSWKAVGYDLEERTDRKNTEAYV